MRKFGSQGKNDGEFNIPSGIFVDQRNDQIIVADSDNYRIQVFDSQGKFLRKFGSQGKKMVN